MKIYSLYLESGPRKKKTMVHVPDLLGCVATGRTTDEALEKTPAAIRDYLHFLHRRGEPVDPVEPFATEIAAHIMEGIWLGNGDPSIVFASDLEPVTPAEIETFIQRLEGTRQEIRALVEGLSEAELTARPPEGRPMQAILEHILESEYNYFYAFGRPEGLPGSGSILTRREGDLLDWTAYVRRREIDRLRSLTEEERREPFRRGQHTYTARKVLRRMLEHQWEHYVELRERLTA